MYRPQRRGTFIPNNSKPKRRAKGGKANEEKGPQCFSEGASLTAGPLWLSQVTRPREQGSVRVVGSCVSSVQGGTAKGMKIRQ